MAIILADDCGWLLCHKSYIDDVYKHCVNEENNKSSSLKMNDVFFEINTPAVMNSAARNMAMNCIKKNKKKSVLPKSSIKSGYHEQVMPFIIRAANVFVERGRNLGLLKESTMLPSEWLENNHAAREAARIVLSKDKYSGILTGSDVLHFENREDKPVIKKLYEEKYVLPPRSLCVLTDVRNIHLLAGEMYDAVILDPPWPNKSVKRKYQYSTMKCCNLLELPLERLMRQGCLVAVWATNRESQLNFIKDKLFPRWGVYHCADWHWLKITQRGNLFISEQGNSSKRPYENLVLGRVPCNETPEFKPCPVPEPHKVIVSVPSSIHSHKPPLTDILKPYLPEEPKCLEVFARYMLPGWTSIGNEVLKLQNLELFERTE